MSSFASAKRPEQQDVYGSDAYASQLSKLESYEDFENEIAFFNANKISSHIQCQAIMMNACESDDDLEVVKNQRITQEQLEEEQRVTDAIIGQVRGLQDILGKIGKNVEVSTSKKKRQAMTDVASSSQYSD